MKPLVVEEEAENELSESAIYYEQRRPGLGLEFEAAISKALRRIQRAPERSPSGKGGVQRHVMRRFPFVIHYLNLPDTIWILAFAHTSRRPDYWRRRLGEN